MTMLQTTIGKSKQELQETEFGRNDYWSILHLPLKLEDWSYYAAVGIGIAPPRRSTDLLNIDDDGEEYFDPFHSKADYSLVKDWFLSKRSTTGVEGDNYWGAKLYRMGFEVDPILAAYTKSNGRILSDEDATRISILKVVAYFGGISEDPGFKLNDKRNFRFKSLEYDNFRAASNFRIDKCEI